MTGLHNVHLQHPESLRLAEFQIAGGADAPLDVRVPGCLPYTMVLPNGGPMIRHVLASALMLVLTAGCSAWRPATARVETPYRVTVYNATGEDVKVEYCPPRGSCSQLGQLSRGTRDTYALPRTAGEAKFSNRILVIGYVELREGMRSQLALAPVHLQEGQSVAVTLSRKQATLRR